MAFFKTIDILKRNNAEILLNIVNEQGEMTLGKKADGKKVQVLNLRIGETTNVTKDDLLEYCAVVKGTPPELLVECTWWPITRFFKDPRFVPKARNKNAPNIRDKEFQQRQEKSLVETINQWNEPVKIENFQYKIAYAKQAPDIGPHGRENLVDVVVWDEHNFSYNVSCKMTKAADLGSGGIAGLQKTVPDLIEKIYYQVQVDLYGLGFNEGWSYHINQVPTILYSIPFTYAHAMFAGNELLGGKIDYFYTGDEKVVFDGEKLNGTFWPVETYAKKKPYYLRLRKRNVFDSMVKINFSKLNSYGLPCIFTSGNNDFVASRWVIDDRIPPNAIVKNL